MDTKFGTVSFASECNINYTPDGIECGVIDSFVYVICNNVGCDTALVTISLECEPIEGVNLIFSNGFSPNGDEINDYFTIESIQSYPNNRLEIFNRWGNLVYFKENYKNDWDGTYNGTVLPIGAYTYIIEYKYFNPKGTDPNPQGSPRTTWWNDSLQGRTCCSN